MNTYIYIDYIYIYDTVLTMLIVSIIIKNKSIIICVCQVVCWFAYMFASTIYYYSSPAKIIWTSPYFSKIPYFLRKLFINGNK